LSSHKRGIVRAAGAAAVVVALTALLAACGGSSGSSSPSGKAVKGGTAYFAEQPLTPPNYIFPLVSGEYYTGANTADLQTLLYRPLYWFGDQGNPGADYALSLADAPVYSDNNRVVTITLKPNSWSDGEPVSARDVGFWINLLKANTADWASYVPGGFPDNVSSWQAVGSRTIRLTLNASYNPIWYSNNELSQITPLPIAWDRTSASAPAPQPNAADLPDTTTAGAKAVYAFLNAQSKKVSTYSSSPIWSIVDGAWKLTQLTSNGQATFVPNPHYTGPQKPHLAKFVELPFTSSTAEFSVIKAGPAKRSNAGSTAQVSVGYVPDNDLPQEPALKQQGYQLITDQPYGFDYFEPNFNNPQVGPILRQLYFRQAFQHLVDQPGWVHAYYHDLAVPTYSPVPAEPTNPYSNAQAKANPYPFSISTAKSILADHGWKVVPGGVTTCTRPGTGASDCGVGIPAGKQLTFTMLYPSGTPYTDDAMTDLQSEAAQAGIKIALKEVTPTTIDETIEPCKPSSSACSWQLGNYGGSWLFEPDHYPSGEEIFQTGALGNVNNYSDPAIDKLIRATTTTSAGNAQTALNAYANTVRTQLADFWQPAPGTMLTVQSNLGGVVPNAYDFISPEQWYFTS
jgi:peptide/nickel transport system substrate-binding protein